MDHDFKAGDRVRKRGLGYLGTVARVGPTGWVTVDWDGRENPKICTPKEIEFISSSPDMTDDEGSDIPGEYMGLYDKGAEWKGGA